MCGAGADREDFRLFKLNRMTDLTAGEPFRPGLRPCLTWSRAASFRRSIRSPSSLTPACRWRLVEEYGADRFTVEPDGRLRLPGGFPDADSILSWVLTFGDKGGATGAAELREQLGLTETLSTVTGEN